MATNSSLKDSTRRIATDFSQSVPFPAKTCEPPSQYKESDSSAGDVFESTLLSSSDMRELEQFESDEDYQYENRPSGICELDSKIEYSDISFLFHK